VGVCKGAAGGGLLSCRIKNKEAGMGMFDKIKEGYSRASDEHEKKKLEKMEQLLNEYGLNLSEYSEQEMRAKNYQNIKRILSELKTGAVGTLTAALGMKTEDQAKLAYMKALTEQNWIIIRQNEAMIRLLTTIAK
jgi:hypothetical protein